MVQTGFFISIFLWFSLQFGLQIPKEWKKDSEALVYIEPLAPGIISVLEPLFPKVKEMVEVIKKIAQEYAEKANF